VAVASAGPYASIHLAPDRQPRQHPTTQDFLNAGCPSCRPTNSVCAIYTDIIILHKQLKTPAVNTDICLLKISTAFSTQPLLANPNALQLGSKTAQTKSFISSSIGVLAK